MVLVCIGCLIDGDVMEGIVAGDACVVDDVKA